MYNRNVTSLMKGAAYNSVFVIKRSWGRETVNRF